MFTFRIGARATRLGGALGLVALWGCEFPTKSPTWTTNWEVRVDSSSLSVVSFLPASVTNSPADTTFVVSVPAPAAVSTSLGAICGAPCSAAATVPIPAFNNSGAPVAGTIALPLSVLTATLKGGSINVALTNNLGFDPLRPSGPGGPFGTLRVLITSSGVTVADTTLSGASLALTPGATVTPSIALRPVAVTSSLSYSVTVICPGSASTASINPASTFAVAPTVVPGSLRVRSASVTVASQSFSDSSSAMDLSGISLDVTKLQGAGLVLNVTNPLTIGGSLSATLTAPGVPSIAQAFVLTPAPSALTSSTTTQTLLYNAAQFSPFIGKSGVRLKLAGTVNATGPGSSVAITPGQVLTVRTNVRADINLVSP